MAERLQGRMRSCRPTCLSCAAPRLAYIRNEQRLFRCPCPAARRGVREGGSKAPCRRRRRKTGRALRSSAARFPRRRFRHRPQRLRGSWFPAPEPAIVLPPNAQYVCVTEAAGQRQQVVIEFSPKVAAMCVRHPEMGPCQYERNACRRSGGRVFAAGGKGDHHGHRSRIRQEGHADQAEVELGALAL